MRTALTAGLAVCLVAAVPVLADPAPASPSTDATALDAQYQAAQLDVQLATIRLGLVQAQMRIRSGQLVQARQELNSLRELIGALASQTDVTAYRQVADRLDKDLFTAVGTQQRLADLNASAPTPPPGTPGQSPTDPTLPGYGNPRIVDPAQPPMAGQVDLAVEQARLAEEHAYTNVTGSRNELSTDPAVVRQRTLDHQTLWDAGRYAPAAELIDSGKMLELDRERIQYQAALYTVRNGARRDELLHVDEATVPPPHVMNFPSDWKQISERRAQYADGKLWESAPFKDADGKMKTVVVYDVSDLLFVPIFPGPSEYNVVRPTNPLNFWTGQARLSELYTHPSYSYLPYGYGAPPYPPAAPTPIGGPAYGGRTGGGGYYGNGVTDVIGSAYYYAFENDPIYQYRLAQKRARLLQAVNRALSVPQE